MARRVPIAREEYREALSLESVQIRLQDRDHRVRAPDAKGAAGQEIVLDIGDEQGVMGGEGCHESMKDDLVMW
jgi:hypothetical protein